MTKKIIITTTPELRNALEDHAHHTERSMAWIIRRAIARYLEDENYNIERVHPPMRGGYRENAGRKPEK